MSKFSDDLLDEIKQVPMVDLCASAGIATIASHKSAKFLCPFHSETTPSCVSYYDSNRFHCFGCGKDGDNIELWSQLHDLSFQDAVEAIAEIGGIDIDRPVRPQDPAVREYREAVATIDKNLDLVALIKNSGVKLERQHEFRKGGREYYSGVCPFHLTGPAAKETLNVYPHNNRFRCYYSSCEAEGGIVEYHAQRNNLKNVDAIRELSAMIGIRLSAPPAAAIRTPLTDVAPKEIWKPISIKLGQPEPPFPKGVLGQCYEYRDLNGDLLHVVIRREFKDADGKPRKTFSPWTYGYLQNSDHPDGSTGWFPKAYPDPRPIYNLFELSKRPTAPVLIVEGEKSQERAEILYGHEYVVISWSGGTNGIQHIDWSPLAGRYVVFWPDADRVGRNAAHWFYTNVRCASITVLPTRDLENIKKGFDAADLICDSFSDWLRDRLARAEVPIYEDEPAKAAPTEFLLPEEPAIAEPIAPAPPMGFGRKRRSFGPTTADTPQVQQVIDGSAEIIAETPMPMPAANAGTVATLENPGKKKKKAAPVADGDLIAEMNQHYCVVNKAGKMMVFYRRYDDALEKDVYDLMTFESFHQHNHNKFITIDDEKVRRSTLWLANENARTYPNGSTFNPKIKGDYRGYLNLWEGFDYEPVPGTWTKFRDHLFNVICRGNQANFDYLIRWIARIYQQPDSTGEICVVLIGKKGSGKSIVGDILRNLCRKHSFTISNADHLVGRFNSHLMETIFLVAEEAFFVGNKQHYGVLKDIITRPFLTIEEKFQRVVQAKNYIKMLWTTNHRHAIPAEDHERRYFGLDVSDEFIGNFEYFDAIYDEMKNGGYEAMLHDLLALDLSNFNVRNYPETESNTVQRSYSLDTFQRWLYESFNRGYMYESTLGLFEDFRRWDERISVELAYKSFQAFERKVKDRHNASLIEFGKRMSEVGFAKKRLSGSRIVVDERMEEKDGARVPKAYYSRVGDRPYLYELGNLTTARAMLDSYAGFTLEWDENDGHLNVVDGTNVVPLKVPPANNFPYDPNGYDYENLPL